MAPSRSRSSPRRTSSKRSSSTRIQVNRAPLLLLWVAVVAQREGYKFTEGLSFGRAVTIICGHSKGKAIGLFRDTGRSSGSSSSRRPRRKQERGVRRYRVFGMTIHGRLVKGRRYAVKTGRLLAYKSAQAYVKKAFGTKLGKAKAALRKLAGKYPRDVIGKRGYSLYEKFRPRVPSGLKGWGAKGVLDLSKIDKLTLEAAKTPTSSTSSKTDKLTEKSQSQNR